MTQNFYKLSDFSLSSFPSLFKGKGGVYVWVNLKNGKRCVGSSIDLSRRVSEYLNPAYLTRQLMRGESKIYRAMLKYGYNSFGFEILELVELNSSLSDKEKDDILFPLEQKYMDKLLPEYNILLLAGTNRGHIMSEQARIKISLAKKGKPSHRKGKIHTETARTFIKLNSVRKRLVYVYDTDNVLLNTFTSITECESFTGFSRHRIGRAIKTMKPVDGKYIFKPNPYKI